MLAFERIRKVLAETTSTGGIMSKRRSFPFSPSRTRPTRSREAKRQTKLELSPHLFRLASAMAGYGGVEADEIYNRLNLGREDVSRDTFRRFVAMIQAKAKVVAGDTVEQRVNAVANIFWQYFHSFKYENPAPRVVKRIGARLANDGLVK